jgi:hypothetical protein
MRPLPCSSSRRPSQLHPRLHAHWPSALRTTLATAALSCLALLPACLLAAPATMPNTASAVVPNANNAPAARTTATSPAAPTSAAPATLGYAIVLQDAVPLRNAARDSAPQQAVLAAGDRVEVRAERLDYLQVYDHQRERGGFVKASALRRTQLAATEAPELLNVLRFLRDTSGSDGLGIGMAAAYLQAAPAEQLLGPNGAEAFDALGGFAEHLARRASTLSSNLPTTTGRDAVLWAHLDVAARYGVRFVSLERDGRIQQCYDGEAYRRVLALPATPQQQARAALALTREDCIAPEMRPVDRKRWDEWRLDVLQRVDTRALSPYLKNRVLARRAGVLGSVAFARTRMGESGATQAAQALDALAQTSKADTPEDDAPALNDAAMRVNANRWAAVPAAAAASSSKGLRLSTAAGEPGQTCLLLLDSKHDEKNPLQRQCTYSLVWLQSASTNREGTALAVAVQPTDSWRELWVFRQDPQGWSVNVLPPSSSQPALGYAEFAGWVPGGKQMLVARESRSEGKYRKSFEVLQLDTLSTERQSADASTLGPFQRWSDPSWKRLSVSLR